MVNKPNINQLRPHFLFANVRQRWFAHLTPLHQFLFLFFLMDEGSGDETDLEEEPPKKKMRRTTSEVWCYFSKTDTGSECKICSNYIATHNTTQLWRHINNLHTQAELIQSLQSTTTVPLANRIVQWIIKSKISLNSVDNIQFRQLFDRPVPSRQSLAVLMEKELNIQK